MPLISRRYVLTGQVCPDLTGHHNLESQEGKSHGIFVPFLG